MEIESIHIKNLRSCADVLVSFNAYTCLVGPNGAGKSTILCALNIFFREIENSSTDLTQLEMEDFHKKDISTPIEITVTFKNLSSEAKSDFSDYFRQDRLIITAAATFNSALQKAEVKQYGQRLAMPEFKDFFEALGDRKNVSELKEIYKKIRETFTDLEAPGTKDAMIAALREYETQHPNLCKLIPSEDQFYGVSKGADRLAKYIQWVFVPAVKDATTEQAETKNTALGKLLARTVRSKTNFDEQVTTLRDEAQRKYQELLTSNQHVLAELSLALKTRLSEWAHPDATLKLEWRQDPNKSVRVEEPFAQLIAGESDFEGNLARFGHGLQRSYLLALLHELSNIDDPAAPKLILGIEEPELYQHPPQARHLVSVLQKLSEHNAQVVVCTHSPYFVSGYGFEDVRLVIKDATTKCTAAKGMAYSEVAAALASAKGEPTQKPSGVLAKINQALQPALNEMFFTNRLILAEGLEDVAYILSYLNLMNKWEDYRRLGCHVVPTNGKSEILQPLVVAKHVKIATLVAFDADADKPDNNGSRTKHEKDNRALLNILGQPGASPMPSTTLWGKGFVMWHSDIGSIVSEEIGGADWQRFKSEADKIYGHAGGLGKNTLHIGTSLTLAWNEGKKSSSLEKLCAKILDSSDSI